MELGRAFLSTHVEKRGKLCCTHKRTLKKKVCITKSAVCSKVFKKGKYRSKVFHFLHSSAFQFFESVIKGRLRIFIFKSVVLPYTRLLQALSVRFEMHLPTYIFFNSAVSFLWNRCYCNAYVCNQCIFAKNFLVSIFGIDCCGVYIVKILIILLD